MAANRSQCKGIYEYQANLHFISSPSAFTDLNDLFDKINGDIKCYLLKEATTSFASTSSEEDKPRDKRFELNLPLSLGLLNSNLKKNSFRYWTKESLEFFRFQALEKVLTKIQFDHNRSLDEMLRECRLCYCGNPVVVKTIDDLKDNYQTSLAIWYYTCDMFLFRMVGQAFRSEEFEHIFKFRRYIIDLYHELEMMHGTSAPSHVTLYRGKKLSSIVLQQLKDNEGALVSMNGFLSTTRNKNIAKEIYADIGENRGNYHSVLFEFFIDSPIVSKPNADISSRSQFSEDEVLFSFGSVWRIDSVEEIDNALWLVKLQSCDELDSNLNTFFGQFPDDNTFIMLGHVLRELGQHTKVKNFYQRMLTEPMITDEIRGIVFFQIAEINLEQNDYDSAVANLREAENRIPLTMIELESTSSPRLYAHSIVPSRLRIFNNMGLAYLGLGDHSSALEYFQRALDITRSDPVDKATVHDNIGMLLYADGKYTRSLQHLEEAVALAKDYSCIAKFKQHYDNVKKHVPQDE